ncbi:hypothetical protein E4656_10485 [Natronospirillum operosum]|uniref:Carboxypeptidase regulatory-like domain-containing protein n=1 Tax=Natronospirillum operosum TaxID=2759953 RepID=A0A4Z0WE73_9GAMM|nr:hypothetical protein [Natronospirillum operosum]TGG93466.1 hypothetical protein E4656_10485 [Natronospirillum operosum]
MKTLMQLASTGLLALALALPAAALDYWSGGVGSEARAEAPTDYNTTFEFFERSGSFLAGVEVRLTDGNGDVLLETTSTGPWLMVNLDEGAYRIEATRESTGEVQRVRFNVASGQQEKYGLRFME